MFKVLSALLFCGRWNVTEESGVGITCFLLRVYCWDGLLNTPFRQLQNLAFIFYPKEFRTAAMVNNEMRAL